MEVAKKGVGHASVPTKQDQILKLSTGAPHQKLLKDPNFLILFFAPGPASLEHCVTRKGGAAPSSVHRSVTMRTSPSPVDGTYPADVYLRNQPHQAKIMTLYG